MTDNTGNDNDSISGASATLSISKDESIASLIMHHGIKVSDFILLSFLSDQGPMSALRLARIVGLAPEEALRGIKRLAGATLVLREPLPNRSEYESAARLTARGEGIARRISEQL